MPVKSSPKSGKLRRTCEAVYAPVLLYLCASVKVKCSKEKPECSRCQHRGITCQYFVEKRPGRKRQLSRHTSDANSTAATMACCCGQAGSDIRQPSQSSLSTYSFSPYTSSTMSDERGGFESAHLSLNFMLNGPFNDDMAAVDHSSVFSAFEGGCGNMSADLVAARSELDRLGVFRPSTVSEPYQPPTRDIASLVIPIEDMTEFTPISESISIPDTSSCSCCSSTSRLETSPARFSSTGPSTAPSANISTGGVSPADIPESLACQCLDQALELLKNVSGSLRTSSTTPDGDESWTGFSSTETHPQWFKAMLSENRQCLGTMDHILACSSINEDSMLPGILCMILFKILERYSNMAWSRSLLSHSRSRDIAELGSNISGYLIVETGLMASNIHRDTFISSEQGQMKHIHLDGGISQHSDDEPFGRAIAHLVLGELHWVQRVVNNLVARLKCPDCHSASRPTHQSCGWESRQQTTPVPMEEPGDLGLTSSFSATTLEHMATDVQKRLTTLSSSIINELRRC
ncbi:hypothetical protein V8C40DRAFT_281194 [Trichoderma camerunense]